MRQLLLALLVVAALATMTSTASAGWRHRYCGPYGCYPAPVVAAYPVPVVAAYPPYAVYRVRPYRAYYAPVYPVYYW